MSTKQVTITVTQSIRQVDKSGKVKEKSLTTYEVMKPMEALKEVTTENTEVHWETWAKVPTKYNNQKLLNTVIRTFMSEKLKASSERVCWFYKTGLAPTISKAFWAFETDRIVSLVN